MNILNELRAAYAAATPGEWRTVRYLHGLWIKADCWRSITTWIDNCNEYKGDNLRDAERQVLADANLITLMHNHLPALLECVEALRTIVDSEEYHGDLVVCDFDTLQGVARAALTKLGED